MTTDAPPARQLKLVAFVTAWLALALAVTYAAPAQAQEIWRFDQTASLGSHATRVLGHPQVIDTEMGKAIAFNGVDDALFVGVHPLAGAATWTWEMIFKPDADGKPEQRVLHLQSVDPATGADIPDQRMLFEIRIHPGPDGQPQWCLDSFATGGGHSRTLLNCDKLHPFGKWYRVTAVYDGKMLRNYVGDEMQGEGELVMPPQGPGRSSVGVRINLLYFYKGAMYEARFTRRDLPVQDFLKLPAAR
jgi:hypothetical protein